MEDKNYNSLNGKTVNNLVIENDGDIRIEFTDDTYAHIISLGEDDNGVLRLDCQVYNKV